jgi:hypothetical protein
LLIDAARQGRNIVTNGEIRESKKEEIEQLSEYKKLRKFCDLHGYTVELKSGYAKGKSYPSIGASTPGYAFLFLEVRF